MTEAEIAEWEADTSMGMHWKGRTKALIAEMRRREVETREAFRSLANRLDIMTAELDQARRDLLTAKVRPPT